MATSCQHLAVSRQWIAHTHTQLEAKMYTYCAPPIINNHKKGRSLVTSKMPANTRRQPGVEDEVKRVTLVSAGGGPVISGGGTVISGPLTLYENIDEWKNSTKN